MQAVTILSWDDGSFILAQEIYDPLKPVIIS